MDAYAAFRYRDYRLLVAGNFLASLGFQMLSVAAGWDLYVQTRSAVVLGNVGFVQVAPFLLFALLAGHLADSHDRRQILTLAQAVFVVVSLVLLSQPGSVLAIYASLFLAASARTFQGPARTALVAGSVPAETLRNAITWSTSAHEIASVSGPAIAGVLLAWMGSRSVYVLHGFCAIAAFTLFSLLRPRTPAPAIRQEVTMRSLLEGVAFVRRRKLVLSAISLDMFAVLFGGVTTLLPIFALEILHTDARGLGWLRAAPSIGAMLMALTLTHFLNIRNAGRALLASIAAFGAATIGFGLSDSLWLSFGMLILTGAFDNISVVLRHSLIQSETPDYLRGRVAAVNNLFINCSNQLGAVESGWAAALMGIVPSVLFGGAATIAIVSAFAVGNRRLLRWRQ